MFRVFSLTLFLFLFFSFPGEAQLYSDEDDGSSEDTPANFQPNLVFVLSILCIMVALTLILVIYTRFCQAADVMIGDSLENLSLIRSGSGSRNSGIDKTVIESLPFFRFSSLKGSKGGLECSVCLSKFEDIEILRFLPKCQHAFHRNCIDQWLEKHSSCPLCRCTVTPDDMTSFTYSNSMRFLTNQSDLLESSSMELFIQREASRQGSSRFSFENSFRRIEKVVNKDEEAITLGTESVEYDDHDADGKHIYHKFNHKIIVSDVVFNNRWSNLSSSDLMSLNSEMLQDISSRRFSYQGSDNKQFTTSENCQKMTITEEMEITGLPGSKCITITDQKAPNPVPADPSTSSERDKFSGQNRWRGIIPHDRRSVSEITGLSRFRNSNNKHITRDSFPGENRRKEEKLRQLWLPIARKTVERFSQQADKNTGRTPHV